MHKHELGGLKGGGTDVHLSIEGDQIDPHFLSLSFSLSVYICLSPNLQCSWVYVLLYYGGCLLVCIKVSFYDNCFFVPHYDSFSYVFVYVHMDLTLTKGIATLCELLNVLYNWLQ